MKRRALLSSLGGSFLAGTAGCLSDSPGTPETPQNPQTTRPTTTTNSRTTTQTDTPEQRAGIGVLNEDDESYTLSIRVTDGDETLLDKSVDVHAGPGYGRGVEGALVGEGTYRVVAELDTGARLDYEWQVTDDAGHLEIVVTSDGELEPRQRSAGGIDDENLPYSVSGTKDIFAPPSVEIRNESDADATVTVAIEYDGDRFFDQTFDATTDREISTPPVVKSHATYDVVAETADGQRVTYDWHIPEMWAWPVLAVLVASDGTLRVGCGWPRTASVRVENTDDTEREVTMTLSDDDGVVSETTQVVAPARRRFPSASQSVTSTS
ncbi:hypothetical protein [Haloferax sp. YSSS75]|uniref:hypothetical protein n=1 Tax=Haloferax sp. YSSS75 TaxID=3388564 RepID=UPI00398D3CEE